MQFVQREHSSEPITADTIELFSRYYEEQLTYKSEILDQLLKCPQGTRYLEVQAALGNASFEMLNRNRQIDITMQEDSELCVAYMQHRIESTELAGRCTLLSCTATDMPFCDESFDLIFSINALRTWEDPHAVISEIVRLLAPGGMALINDLRRDLLEPFAEYRIRELQGLDYGDWMIRNFVKSWRGSYSMAEVVPILHDFHSVAWKVKEDGPMAMSIELVKEMRL
ncbi:class I SAM-dependent methyltransferase [Paenibacillus sp. NPDC057934]|uniref:class I SAM-dependent methyltransferase n=1 Tax=Paenibacillus sp. NPDC057934 TaxID=3346282 RepID=UPI0036D86421